MARLEGDREKTSGWLSNDLENCLPVSGWVRVAWRGYAVREVCVHFPNLLPHLGMLYYISAGTCTEYEYEYGAGGVTLMGSEVLWKSGRKVAVVPVVA